ncbi:MAG: hypothetical protein ACHP84_05910 [Caulobacterales bacterium]
MSGALVAVVGMVREARTIAADGVVTLVNGGDAAKLARELDEALYQGAVRVISFGLCGGLDPTMKVGDVAVATSVVAEGRRWDTDPAWTERLAGALPGARQGPVTGSAAIVATAEQKNGLRLASGALTCDLESHVVARVASNHGAPFAVVRAVSDAAQTSLPKAALVGLGANGRPDIGRVLQSVLADPRQLPALIRLALDTEAAFDALEDAAAHCRDGHGWGNSG